MSEYPDLETQTGFEREKSAAEAPRVGDSRSALRPGTVLGEKYSIERVIHNRSQFSIVYLARDTKLQRSVVIKEFFPRDFVVRTSESTVAPESSGEKNAFEDARAKFIEEGRTLASIKDAGVVTIFDAFQANDTAYLVMEKIEGHTLADFPVRGESVNSVTFEAILRKLLAALRVVHSLDLVHRDLKPNNVLIRARDGQPVLIDFGAARQVLGTATQDFTRVFAPGFSPPEQTSQKAGRAGGHSDLYSLAATLLTWVSGVTPPDANDRMHALLDGQPDPMLKFGDVLKNRGFNPAVLATLDQCLELKAKDRPKSVDEVLARIAVEVKPPEEPRKLPRGVAIAALLLLLLLVLIFWDEILLVLGIVRINE